VIFTNNHLTICSNLKIINRGIFTHPFFPSKQGKMQVQCGSYCKVDQSSTSKQNNVSGLLYGRDEMGWSTGIQIK